AVALGGLWAGAGQEPPKPPPATGEPAQAGKPPFGFTRLALDANDLADAYSLNVYMFRVEIPKGQQFHVVLRELDAEDAAPRELKRFSFRQEDKDGPTALRVELRRVDGAGGVLLTEQKQAGFRVSCPYCQPTGMASVVPVPLSGVKLTERTLIVHQSDKDNTRWGVKETRLLSV